MNKIFMFDLDGTLVNSMPSFSKAIIQTAENENISYPDDLVKIVTPIGYEKTAEYILSLGAKNSKEEILKYIKDTLYVEYSQNIKLKDGVKEFLTKQHQNGARLFVLTASPHLLTDVCLKQNGVYHLFEKVWSVEDYSLNKTDERIFIKAAQNIGCLPNEVNYFEDNIQALTNAKKAGFKTYAVFDNHSDSEVEFMKSSFDYFVKTYKDAIKEQV